MKEQPHPDHHSEAPLQMRDISRPENFINWQLSLLEFNWRVLAQTLDTRTPLLERLKFLFIFSTNMDEFYEIRVAGLKLQAAYLFSELGPENMTPQEILAAISRRAHDLVAEQYRILSEIIFPRWPQRISNLSPAANGMNSKEAGSMPGLRSTCPSSAPWDWTRPTHFPASSTKVSILSSALRARAPLAARAVWPLSRLPAVFPGSCRSPRRKQAGGSSDFVFLSSIIHAFVEELFPQMEVTGYHQFRVTRNSELYVDEEEIDGLRRAISGHPLNPPLRGSRVPGGDGLLHAGNGELSDGQVRSAPG
jgi:polyphosphate kinase